MVNLAPVDEPHATALLPAASAGGGQDLISALPYDILVSILACLRDTGAAARTSVLSRSWRDLWLGLPTLHLVLLRPDSSGRARAALAAYSAKSKSTILALTVRALYGAEPDAAASLLRSAEPHVPRELRFQNRCLVSRVDLYRELLDSAAAERGAFELPCLRRATHIWLKLGFHTLVLPQSGVFAALKALRLDYVQFGGQCTMGDTMLPLLRTLSIHMTRGLVDLTIRSTRLGRLYLGRTFGLRRLAVEAPELVVLKVVCCFYKRFSGPIAADIKAEKLEMLQWTDSYHPSVVKFSEMPRLKQVSPVPVFLSGSQKDYNESCERILKRFSRIHRVDLCVGILPDLVDFRPLIECITSLPAIEILYLEFTTRRHVYGASVLHLLTMCTGIRVLSLVLYADFEGQNSCPLHCACDPKPDWRSQSISIKELHDVEIVNFCGKDHEVDLVKQLLRVAPALRKMRITCHPSFAGREDLENFMTQERETPVELTYPQWSPRTALLFRSL